MRIKNYALCFLFFIASLPALRAQSTVLGTSVAGGTYTSYNLADNGKFRQVRIQAGSAAAAGSRTWEFGTGTAGSPTLSTNWRPVSGSGSQIQLPGYNQYVAPAAGSPPSYGSATANTSSGGTSGTLPAVVSGNYYTFNITENSSPGTPVNENMSVLATTYNPVNITASSHSPSTPNAGNSVLVSVSTSAAPSSGEYLYVRYSTNVNFTASSVVQVSMSGSGGTAIIPCQSAGTTVYYYVFSSPKTLTQLTSDAGTYGQSAYDMATLEIRNNGGSNFSYTVGTGASFSGTYYIPSTCYPTVSSFVTALNAGSISGPVTVYVSRGHKETAPASGIYLTTTGTASNPIRFLAYGSGPKPLINAGTGSNSLSTSSVFVDFIWGLNASDYVTIDGFDLADSNASGTAQMEAGFMVFRKSNLDASQNVTIRNCKIWFAAPQNPSGPTPFENGNKGIAFVPAVNGALTSTLTIIGASGRCQNDTIEADTVINAYTGILLRGGSDGTIPYAYIDQNIVIGGNTAAKGCVVFGFGENGIKTYNVNNAVVRFNNVDNNNQIGYSFITTGFNISGINLSGQGTNNANLNCTDNTITVRNNKVTSSFVYGIRSLTENNGLGTVFINDNTVTNCYNLYSGITGIMVTQTARQVTVMRNTVTRSRCNFSTGAFTGIQWGNSSGYPEKARIRENTVNRDTSAYSFSGITGASGSNTYLKGFEVSRNTIGSMNTADGILLTNIGTTSYGINNSISNFDYNNDSNLVAGIRMLAGTGTFYGIYDFGVPGVGLHTVRGNTIAKISGSPITGTQTFEGIRQATGTSGDAWVTGNTIRNIDGFSTLKGLYTGYCNFMDVSNNTIDSLYTNPLCTSPTTCIGLDHSASTGDSIALRNNTITRIYAQSAATTSTSMATGLNIATGGLYLCSGNRISDVGNLTSSTSGYARGLFLASATRIFAWNNAIANITAPNVSTTTPSVVGIELNSSGSTTTPSRVFNNSVYLNASGSSANFASASMYMSSSGVWDVFNNILYNTSTPGTATTAFTAGIWKTSTTIPTTFYTLASNNNLYYLNSSINRKYLVYRNSGDGAQDSTLCQFTTRLNSSGGPVQTREASSVQAAVSFLSTSRTSSNFMLVDNTVSTFAESGGKPTVELVNDFLGASRSLTNPDIGADEFSGTAGTFSTATANTLVTHPSTAAVTNGSRDVQILRAGIRISGISGTAPTQISRLVFNTNGTSSPTNDIDTAKLWYTSANNTFTNAVLIGQTVNPNGAFSYDVDQRITCADTVYFWVTYGVKCPSSTTDVLDCQLDSVYAGGSGISATGGAPTGTRAINVQSGLNGTYTVGGTSPNYSTLNAAVNDLNIKGLTGPVTFDVRPNHIERAPAGGIVLNVNPIGCGVTRPNSTNTLLIRKEAGSGNMPIIAAGTGTLTITSATTVDGIFKILGEDYVTIESLAFRDTSVNTTTTTKAEWGIALLKRNQDDGCKRVVIRNCVIRLDRANMNTTTGNIRVGNGCVGINVSNITNTSTTSSSLITRYASATHDSILIENNTIVNCFLPINWYGPEFAPYGLKDRFDTIRNNTLFNWGGGTIEANGISMMNADRYVITGNNIQNKAGGGVDHTGTTSTFYAIRIGAGTSPTSVIENQSGGIITGNTISLNHSPASSASLTHGGIAVYAGGRFRSIEVSDNKIVNCNFSANSSGTFYGIYNAAMFNSAIYRRNALNNINLAAAKTIYGIYNQAYARYREMTYDSVSNINNTGTNGATLYALYNSFTSTSPALYDSAATYSNNFVYKINYTPSSPSGYTFGGIYTQNQNYVNVDYQNNTIRNIKGLDFQYPLYITQGNVTQFTNNIVDSLATNSSYSSATIYGLFSSNPDSAMIHQNSITRIYANATSSSTLYGLITQSSGYSSIQKNKVADINATGSSTTTVIGLQSNSSFNSHILNNIIGDVKAPAFTLGAATSTPLTGILAAGTANHQILNNTVYLNAASSATNFGSAALYLATTTGVYNVRNNILYNTSTANGTFGYTAAISKTGAGLPTTQYLASSNNNLLYSGTPSASNVIYRNVTDLVSDIYICDFLNRSVSQGQGIRDAYTLTGSLSWASTTATASDYLHINTSTGTLVESAGQPVALVTDDYDGDPRGSTPDIGADEGSFTAASSSLSIATNITQITGGVSQGARNIPILKAEVIVSGMTTTPSLTSIRFNTSGTTNAAADLDSAKVIFTGTNPNFSINGTRFGSTIGGPSGGLTFTGNQPLYCNDTFFFWLVYDVKCGSGGDSVDATANDIVVNSSTYSLSPSNPSGKRAISTPMSGTFTVGGSSPDYATLADALAEINLRGLSGSVTLNVRANHVEVAPAGGLRLGINSSCAGFRSSKTRPIVIQKSGSGNNPLIYGYAGTGLNNSPIPDGIFKIIGEDWVTINGIDLEDSSTSLSNTTLMEWGYALLNSSPADGCKRVVIKNATIKMSKNQRESGAVAVGASGSKAVVALTMLPTENITLPLTSALGTHDSCLFTNLNIQRCQNGIWIVGYNDPNAPYSLFNQRDSITNCRITNYGTTDNTFPLSAHGIRIYETNHSYISGNYVDNIADGGTRNNQQVLGIAVSPTNANGNISTRITKNEVRVYHTNGNNVVSGIYTSAGGSGSMVEITDNKIWKGSGTFTGIGGVGTWYGIRTDNRPGYLMISRDTVMNDTFVSTMYSIFVGGATRTFIQNNLIQQEHLAGNYAQYGIYHSNSDSIFISNNKINGLSLQSTGTVQVVGIYSVSAANGFITGNTVDNLISSLGNVYGFYTSTHANLAINGNTFKNSLGGYGIYGMYHPYNGTNYVAKGNTIENLRGGFLLGIYGAGASNSGRISGNTIRKMNIHGSSSSNYYIYMPNTVNNEYYIDSNLMDGDTILNGYIYGIYLNTSSSNAAYIRNNTIKNCFANGASYNHYGVYATGSTKRMEIRNNVFENDTFNTSSLYHFYLTVGSTFGSMNVTDNTITGNRIGGGWYGFYSSSSGRFMNLNYNTVKDNSFNLMYYGIYMTSGQRLRQIIGNRFSNNIWRSGTATTFYNIYTSNTTTDSSGRIEDNLLENFRMGSTSMTYYGIFCTGAGNNNLTERISRNTIRNIRSFGTTTGTAQFYGIYNSNGTTPSPTRFIDSNEIHLLNNGGNGFVYGIYSNINTGNGVNIRNNRMDSLMSGNGVIGIEIQSSGTKTYNVSRNKISDLIINGTSGTGASLYGFRYYPSSGGAKLYFSNNTIGNFYCASNSILNLRAISLEGGNALDTQHIDHNTVYLNASTAGTNLAATGIYSFSTPQTILRNNLIVNLSTPKGSGRVIALQRSSSTTGTYLGKSNGNSFYAGTPGTSNLIYSDGTNNHQTLAAYQSFIGTVKDSISVTVNPVFQSTAFATDSFLKLVVNNTANCPLNKGGVPVNYVTSDYWNTARNSTKPDIGAHEFSPIPAILKQPVSVTVCPGASAGFKVGNTLSGSSSYQWFRNGTAVSNGGSVSGATTDSLTITGASTADTGTYTVKVWLCQGDSATSLSAKLMLNTNSVAATGILFNPADTVCPGATVKLKVSAGSLGTGASWKWYTASCGGTALGTGDSITVTPSAQTIYFVRAEGTCNTTACATDTVFMRDQSAAATGITASADSTCGSSSVTLTVSGGSLGYQASWKWYTASCGGTAVGTGSSITVSPTATTTYYVRAEGACNTTACVSKTIKVNTLSTAPTSITPSADSTCGSTAVTLTVSGGSLGSNASWKWYTASCGGTAVGTGSSITVTPTATTTYFVRAEGTCNTTACVSKSIKVNTLSTVATGITASVDSTCGSTAVTLTVSGGSLSSNASWKWYTASCGGTAVGTGSSITVTPTATTTYFVRAEGTCNTTACVSKSIKVNTLSTAATGITASADSTCGSTAVTLTVSGGSLGSNASWKWYTASCGGTAVGTGSSITVTPTSTTTYFVRAEGTCNTTACVSKSIKVNTLSTAATSITASADSTCGSTAVTLTVSGGSLGSNASWKWYTASCGGTAVGTGSSITVTPTATTTYFVRAEGTCNTTACVSKSIKVNTLSTAATGITASADSTCGSTAVTLTVSGGSLGSNASWKWYTASCGGTAVGTGSSITVTPTATTTYFVRAEGTCNTTACVSKSIKVNTLSTAATGITASADSTCGSTAVTLTVSGGSLGGNASWKWYTASCGGTAVGTGSSITVTPTATTTYFVRAEGTCNTTACVSKSIKVNTLSSAPASVSASSDSVCRAGSTTLTVSGGSLGNNARWRWYTGSCGGTLVGTGSNVTVNPTVNTTYFVRAEGTCNNTACISKLIIVRDSSIAASGTVASLDTVIPGQATTVKRIGGTLGNKARWVWYANGCGSGSPVGYGDSITVTLTSQTTYYLRAEGLCNNSPCVSRTIYLRDSSKTPTGITATTDSVCSGSSTTLTPSGGQLGFKANWKWYTGSCGGTLIGTGSNITVSPTATTTYYVRAEGPTNITLCAVKTIYIRSNSSAATSVTASADSTCGSTAVTLTASGGSLGYNASWKWYTASCGGTAVGTGSSITVTPTTTATYFVRAEGTCNTTACVSRSVKVNTLSTAATSITASVDSTCGSTAVTLTVSGGSLGSNASWKWYTASCGGTAVGTGNSITVTPTATTTYWVRAEGTCNTTACVSKSIKVNTLSTAATSIVASNDSICLGSNVTLSVSGGTLGGNASWKWYTASCGGTLVGTGNSITVSPASSTTYFVRAEGTCNTTACVSKSVKVNTFSSAASGITATLDSVCNGTSSTLSITGGSLGSNASWKWYTASCGGTLVGTGSSITVTPSSTTTYWARAEGTCNTTACVSKTIKVNTYSSSASSIYALRDSICLGDSVLLDAVGGTLGSGAKWRWYTGSCGGTLIGTGSTIKPKPTVSTTYYLRAEGICNTTACVSRFIVVNTLSTAPTSIISSVDSTCGSSNVTLTVNGGSLGSKAIWRWYTGSCGGTIAGTGSSITVNPATTTTYWVRAEGLCNTTACASKTIKVNSKSVAPTGITASKDTTCGGSTVTLTVNGGTLGFQASWKWYSGSCGGTAIGTGTSVNVSPTATTTYYVRAEGLCNTTVCAAKTITIHSKSTAATAIAASADSTCGSTSVNLTVSGGSLGTGGSWKWYSGSCGGTSVGTGNTISVTPGTTTTYFVRAEGFCNTTACVSRSVKVNTLSTAASGITASKDTTCGSTAVTLSVSGGSLGSNARWRWYTASCGGTLIGTGNSITVTPTTSTTYFVRAEGTCNTTSCASKTITVNSASTVASAIIANTDSTCGSSTVSLSVSGGSLGTNASWRWYSGSCGGTAVGTGNSINVSPTATTTYFLRAEGTCNTTACVTKVIKVNTASVAPTGITSSADSTCGSTAVTLTVNGGSLGSNARWRWYTASCGGTLVGTGSSITVTPTASTTYFVRAEGTCNATACVSKAIRVNTSSVAATSIISTADSTCGSTTVTLTVSGGSLGSNASWRWYSGTCGGTLLGSGTSINVTPTSSTTYFVRAEGTCNTTACVSKTIKVNNASVAATGITSTADSTCGATSVTLTVNGGSLGSNASWKWYDNGTLIGTGSSLVITPTATRTYSVRAEGTCNITALVFKTIKVNVSSNNPTGIFASADSTCGTAGVNMNVLGGSLGSNAQWKWYSGSCGGTLLGTGPSITVNPGVTTTYYVRAEGTCNTTACASRSVKVNTFSVAPTGIAATQDSLCGPGTITLGAIGGTLGSNAQFKWYRGGCGGVLIGTGPNITVSLSSTTTYAVRIEGSCNTTPCAVKTIKVNNFSLPAIGVKSAKDSICPGENITLTVDGGTLGGNARWRWYSNGCGSLLEGTGSSITVSPSANTVYFVRAEGTCNNTTCASKLIIVKGVSNAAASVSASQDTVCKGQSTTLQINGGSLGTGARWGWYTGSCGGTLVGTGNAIVVSPVTPTTYYVRAEGSCNTTFCITKTIFIQKASVPAVAVISSSDTTCGGPVTLSVSGGSLGRSGQWKWYDGGCGTGLVGSGSSISVTPSAITTYYVRAEDVCGNTVCATHTIYTSGASTAPTGIVFSTDTPCLGKPVTMTVVGGNLAYGARWKWYHTVCGGNFGSSNYDLGSGRSLTDIPNGYTDFYVRAEGYCGNTACVGKSIRILQPSKIGTGIKASADTVSFSENITLEMVDGSTGDNGQWVWYEGGCGSGTPVARGKKVTVKPSATTTYYVRGESTCDSSVCLSKTIVVRYGTGIGNGSLANDLKVYPNPTSGWFTMELPTAAKEETLIEVLDISGRVVNSFTMSTGSIRQSFNLGAISEGQYMLRFRLDDQTILKRLVKFND